MSAELQETKSESCDLISAWPTDSDWNRVLQPALNSRGFHELAQFVTRERTGHQVFPPAADVFRAFRLTSFAETRVVILGQDPYHGPGQAQGLSFSVPEGTPWPPSLKNIFRELSADLSCPLPQSGDLSRWSRQGVLLLNSVLTVRSGQANSHAGRGWEEFTDEVIRQIGHSSQRPVIFLLWGKPAQRKQSLINPQHPVLGSPHPSPLSAYRGFFGSRPFSRINQLLASWQEPTIDWIG
jgi:uracil-DNA glycosylase